MKKHTITKKTLSILMAFLLVWLYIPTATYADTATLYRWDNSGNQTGEAVSLTTKNNQPTQLFKVREWNGSSLEGNTFLAYCIDLETFINNTTNYRFDVLESVDYFSSGNPEKIRAVIYGSYPAVSLSDLRSNIGRENLTKKEAVAATQMAIWHFANTAEPKAGTYSDPDTDNTNGRIAKLYNYLIGLDAIAGPVVATINTTGPIVSWDSGEIVVTFSYSTTGVNNLDNSAIDLSHSYTFTGTETEPTSGSFEIRIDPANISPSETYEINISGNQSLDDALVFTPLNSDGTPNRKASQTLVSTGVQDNVFLQKKLEFSVDGIFGGIKVNKTFSDESDDEVTFELYKSETLVASQKTDKLTTTFSDLVPGSYTLKELNVEGYTNNLSEDTSIEVTPGQTTTFDVVNTLIPDPKGNLQIDKTFEDQSNTEVKFELYLGQELVESDFTDGQSLTWNDLAPGTYKLVEISPTGYTSPYVVGVDVVIVDGETTEVKVQNTLIDGDPDPKGNLQIHKTFKDQSNTEVKFELYLGEELVDSAFTVEQFLEWKNLTPGTYTLVEISPTGYTSPYVNGVDVVIVDGQTTEVDVLNTLIDGDPDPKGNLQIHKTFEDQSNTEVKFELYLGEELVDSAFTVEQFLEWKNLTPGTYTLVEISPTGYTSPYVNGVEVDIVDGETTEVDVLNTLNKEDPVDLGSIKVKKSYFGGLEGPEVTFNLTNNDNVEMTQTTVGLETIFSNLKSGEYRLTEIVPNNFTAQVTTSAIIVAVVNDPSAADVTVEGENQTVVNFLNTPISTPNPDPTPDPEPNPDPIPEPEPTPDPDPVPDPEPIGPRGTVRVHYEDTEGNELASPFEFSSGVGSIYNTAARTFDGYELIETPSNASGTFIDGTIDVIYVYSDGEELEVEPEPTPLAPPVVPDEPEAIEDEMIEEEVIEEPIEEITLTEEIPLGNALPQTGQIPAEIFFGIGSIISLAGISLKKKSK